MSRVPWPNIMDECEDFRHDMMTAASERMLEDERALEKLRHKLNALDGLLKYGRKFTDEESEEIMLPNIWDNEW